MFFLSFRRLIPLLLISIFIYPLSSCGKSPDTKVILEPYKHIASELLNNKIVMLADFQHFSMLPHCSLIELLNCWKDAVKSNKLQNAALTLVLERSPQTVELINSFINENNIIPWLNYYAISGSLEDIYLLEKLRLVKDELAKQNCRLNIAGFENYYTEEIFYSRTDIEGDRWFVKERDSLLFVRSKEYIEKNKDERILFFYGSAHLIKGLVSKKQLTRGLLKDEECSGYYLAHYLKEYFGHDKVVTFHQMPVHPDYFTNTDLSEHRNNIFMIPGEDSVITKINYKWKDYDWVVIRHENLKPPTFIRFIMSNSVLNICREAWLKNQEWSQKYKKNISSPARESIEYITGRNFQYPGDYEAWLDTQKTLPFERISSEKFSKYLFTIANYDPRKNRYFRRMLVGIGFGPGLYNENYFPSAEEWDNELWPAVRSHVKYFNAVGLLWFGDAKEKEFAREYLYQQTKQRYELASEYLEVWYRGFYGYGFL